MAGWFADPVQTSICGGEEEREALRMVKEQGAETKSAYEDKLNSEGPLRQNGDPCVHEDVIKNPSALVTVNLHDCLFKSAVLNPDAVEFVPNPALFL